MITTAIGVQTDGAVVLSSGATFGILLAILVAHGLVCSAATTVLARLNLFYVAVNGASPFRLSKKNSDLSATKCSGHHRCRNNCTAGGCRGQ